MSTRPSTLPEIFPKPPEGLNYNALDLSRIPKHIAIIMDGNGRWAKAHGLERSKGHKAGIKAVREAITTCNDLGVKVLTIYSFSTENWKRPISEVKDLMELFAKTMSAEVDGLNEEKVCIKLLGDVEKLPLTTRTIFKQAQKRTEQNKGMTLAIAVNYGARAEICAAAKKLAQDTFDGKLNAQDIDEDTFSAALTTGSLGELANPDLCIRTSGEMRLSNFLLWQLAYAEFYVTDCLWPDFDRYELLKALLDFQNRDRRFGGCDNLGEHPSANADKNAQEGAEVDSTEADSIEAGQIKSAATNASEVMDVSIEAGQIKNADTDTGGE